MTNTADVASAAAWEYYSKYATKEFPGTKILATWVHDEGFISTSNKPVRAMEDFKGLKIRAASRQSSKLLARLGATPVGMPIPSVADAMTKGTVDGFLTAWEIIPAFKLQEVSKFHTEVEASRPSLFTAGFVFAMNQAKYDSLAPDVKKAVDELSGEFAARMFGKGWDKVDRRGMAFMQAAGVQMSKADAGFVKAVTEKTDPLVDTWAKAAEAKGMKEPKKALAAFRADIAKLQ
jgi:TRAP-type C4-dicarboxylate transport system substrate-binding protein